MTIKENGKILFSMDATILMLRSVLGRWWALYIVGITIQTVVIIAVLVRFLAPTSSIAKWILNFIYDSGTGLGGPAVFSFIIDWAEALSIAAVYIIFIPVFIRIIETHHKRTLNGIHNWLTDAIIKLTTASEEESVADKLADWKRRLRSIMTGSSSALARADALGNGLKPKMEKAIENLLKLEACINDHAEPAEVNNLLQTTVTAFKDISNLTYNSLYGPHQSISEKAR